MIHVRRILLTLIMAFVALATQAKAEDARGKALFGSDCGLCHQRNGEGVAGQFPRLAGRVGLIAAKAEGKLYLAHVLAAGMTGAITIDGYTIAGYMPSFGQVPAADVAAILTYVTGLGGTPPVVFTTAEIEAARTPILSARAVHDQRVKLVAAKIVP